MEALALDLLRQPLPPALPARVLVYGAGGMGRRVAAWLRAQGCEVEAFLDRRAHPGASCEGLPLGTAEEWRREHGTASAGVVVGIHNPAHPVAEVVSHLRTLGFGPIWTPVDLCNLPGASFTEGFWISPRGVYADHLREMRQLETLLADRASHALLAALLRLRIAGDYAAAPLPQAPQYCPQDLPRWASRLRLIDCGAYVGDTLDGFLSAGYTLDEAICLEPDPDNYARLARHVAAKGLPVMAVPCAVSSAAATLRFSAEAAGSSHLADDGGVPVQALAIDQAFPAFAPNLIKMDVEGAEPQALQGAMETLRRHRPGLAISVYHRAEHLWEIPLMLAGALDDYRYHLRVHSHNGFDIVLYAMPAAT